MLTSLYLFIYDPRNFIAKTTLCDIFLLTYHTLYGIIKTVEKDISTNSKRKEDNPMGDKIKDKIQELILGILSGIISGFIVWYLTK